jgi:acetolactate synthase-1/2/3 large subunit
VQAAEVVLGALEGFEPVTAARLQGEDKPADAAAEAIDWQNRAERPVVLAGNGIRLSGACTDFQQPVDLLGVPVLTTRSGWT